MIFRTIESLARVKNESDERFVDAFLELDADMRAKVSVELPEPARRLLCETLPAELLAAIVNRMRTDDAADMMILLKEADEAKWLKGIELLDTELKAAVRQLMDYSDDESGSLMEIEIFAVTPDETVRDSMKRLRMLIDSHALQHISSVFLVDSEHHLLALFPLEAVVSINDDLTYADLYDGRTQPISVHSRSSVYEAVRLMTRYNLSVLPVINKNGRLLGRITHDDILDYIQEDATRQMYGLGQVDPNEAPESGVVEAGRDRALWLGINLFNVTLVSAVIGLFEHSLQQVVALAVLMPIVANMAGAASMQTLTVVVRQMALGGIGYKEGAPVVFKELKIALLNGALFALLAMLISYARFSSWYLGGVMAAAMFVSFIGGGILSAYVPLGLKRLGIDPAVASSVIVITLVDVIGFFSFLWFATLWIPEIHP